MIDFLIQEQGSGGNIIVRNNDLVTVTGYENQPYAAHFGGIDWWGNDLLLQGDQKFTATTEDVINSTPLTSAGRIAIENAMIDDLDYLTDDVPGTLVDITTAITTKNRLDGTISIDGNDFFMNWNPDASFLNYTLK